MFKMVKATNQLYYVKKTVRKKKNGPTPPSAKWSICDRACMRMAATT